MLSGRFRRNRHLKQRMRGVTLEQWPTWGCSTVFTIKTVYRKDYVGSDDAAGTSTLRPAPAAARPLFRCSADGSSEEMVYKGCRLYMCCPSGAVDASTLNGECETGHDSSGQPNTTSLPRSHGRESRGSPGFVETYIATWLTSSSHSSTERDRSPSAATEEGTSCSRTLQRRSTVQRRGCVRKPATRFRSCRRRQTSNFCAQ